MAEPMTQPTAGAPPLRVLMVIGQFNPIIGGAEKQAEKLARALIALGVDVGVVTFAVKGAPRREIVGGVHVSRVGVLPAIRGGRLKLWVYLLQLFIFLIRRRRRYDILHAHLALAPALAAALAAKILKKPCIVKIGNTGERFDLLTLKNTFTAGPAMARSLARSASAFIATSAAAAEHLLEFGVPRESVRLIPNGVEILPPRESPTCPAGQTSLPQLKSRLGLPPDRLVVLFAGTLHKKKNTLRLLDACAALKDRRNGFLLVILGDGAMRRELEKKIASTGLREHCWIMGFVTNVEHWLAAADAFVLPSLVEGFPNALLEAMAAGLPCAASDLPGCRELISNGDNGLLFDPLDTADVARKIAELLDDPNLRKRLGDAARAAAREKFSIAAVADSYVSLYNSLVKR
ncbi:MAG: glycosyltransferase family 4 protein [bacterium]